MSSVNISEIQYKSQSGQDKLVLEFFEYKTNGFFVDIGAVDGLSFSNTYVMETYLGWTGLCVEPNPDYYKKLIKSRKCATDDLAICDKQGIDDFVGCTMFGGILKNFHPKHLERIFKTRPEFIDSEGNFITYKVKTDTIENLFIKHQVPNIIDYLSIDTEGSEVSIMNSFPFDKYKFRCLTIEHNKWIDVKFNLITILNDNGYLYIKDIGADAFFINSELKGI